MMVKKFGVEVTSDKALSPRHFRVQARALLPGDEAR